MMFQVLLIITTLLCSLVAGLLFAFAVVVMPGIKNLSDREFLHSFQVMDQIIQKKQPLFMVVWVGSILAMVALLVVGYAALTTFNFLLLVLAALLYLAGVQAPTTAVNIPLNNRIQTLPVDGMNEREAKQARDEFETRWNNWNNFRAAMAVVTVVLLILLLVMS